MNKTIKLPGTRLKLPKTHPKMHFANFVPHGLPLLKAHFTVGLRHFTKEYSLPLIVTAVFLFLITASIFLRLSQRSSLASLLANVTSTDQGYGTLQSQGATDELKRNNETVQQAQAPEGSSTSFAINTGRGSSRAIGTPPASTAPSPVFGASLAYFQLDAVKLECTTPKPVAQKCSKRYDFGAGIRAQNGPGTLNYNWRSNMQSANEDATVAIGGGEVLVPLQKVIILACKDPSGFSLQLAISAPVITQSAVLNINHNCSEI